MDSREFPNVCTSFRLFLRFVLQLFISVLLAVLSWLDDRLAVGGSCTACEDSIEALEGSGFSSSFSCPNSEQDSLACVDGTQSVTGYTRELPVSLGAAVHNEVFGVSCYESVTSDGTTDSVACGLGGLQGGRSTGRHISCRTAAFKSAWLCDVPASIMVKKRNVEVHCKDEKSGEWEVSGGVLENPVTVTTDELREQFPAFVDAAKAYVDEENSPYSADDLDSLIGCSASALGETIPQRQRYAVYRSVAFFLGYKDRTQLPAGLEGAIKTTWSNPGEDFVGYREA
ncbi:hypothetical protein R1sor_014909 [Riccia sorocarpa]|uniref:Uncharacterized protein n=1 Tax=Riccia sorocarpa TaxID=122646 RepID=A0ABD3HDX3_9MARC